MILHKEHYIDKYLQFLDMTQLLPRKKESILNKFVNIKVDILPLKIQSQ